MNHKISLTLISLTLSSAAALASTNVPEITGLTFEEYPTSVAGVKTYCGHGANGEFAVVAITDKGTMTGTLYGADSVTYDLSRDASGKIVRTPVASDGRKCGLADNAADEDFAATIRRSAADEPYEYPSDSHTVIYDEDLNRNTGLVYVYRTAIPFTYKVFNNSVIYKDKDKVYAKWAELEATFNSTFGRQLSIRLEVIKDDRLIITDSSNTWPGSTVASTITNIGTSSINDLIGEDAYDVGIIITNISSSEAGLSVMPGAYTKSQRGNAVALLSPSTICHELGHLFGTNHTGTTASSSYRTEPDAGTSIMGYGYTRTEFSFVSVYRIRHCLAMNSHYSDSGRTQLVNNPSQNSAYNNFPYAIVSDNQPPVMDKSRLKRSYNLPKGSLFQFDIKATDPDGDALTYNAIQADVLNSSRGFTSNPKIAYHDQSSNPCVRFQPTWSYGWSSKTWTKDDYTDVRDLSTGAYRFWLEVNDGRDDATHAVGYDAYETVVNIVSGTPFEMTGSYASSYTTGTRVPLTWNVDTDVFGEDSRVRIMLSDDFGATWKYTLLPDAPNNGSAEVILPQISIGKVIYGDESDNKQVNAGLIKVEVIDHVAYAVTAIEPVDSWNYMSGGFTLSASAITFSNTPERYVEISSRKDLPEVADVKAYNGATALDVTYTETDHDSYISRVWQATSGNTTSAFEQIIVINDANIGTSAISDLQQRPANVSGETFDLLGRRVNDAALRPGIYVRGGKLVTI